jgi:hypothetical protein
MEFTIFLLRILEILLGVAISLQSLEFFWMQKDLGPQGVFEFRGFIENDFQLFPKIQRSLIQKGLSFPNVLYLMGLRIALAILLIIVGGNSLVLFSLLLIQLIFLFRFQGAFNGGSDFMTTLILTSLFVGVSFRAEFWPLRLALSYIGVQAVLSYFISGYLKVFQSDWRSGRALQVFIVGNRYQSPQFLLEWIRDLRTARTFSIFVLVFELSFPLALVGPRFCIFYCFLGFTFHLLNFWVFGLNRFVWAWLASYPAIYYLSLVRSPITP